MLVRMIPSSPIQVMIGDHATPETIAQMEAKWGLDRPIPVQYVQYMSNLARGDTGTSIRTGRPALMVALERLPATLELMAASVGLAVFVGVGLGVAAAVYRGRLIDNMTLGFAGLAQAMPAYWLGLLLIGIFAVRLRLLPSFGRGSWQHLIMPTITLSFFMGGLITRLLRSSMLEVLGEDYVRAARSRGLSEFVVLRKYALRNAILPVLTVVGVQIGALVGGAVITEAVFSWPGIGSLAVSALRQRDYPVVQSVVLIVAFGIIVTNLVVDILYARLDPRISQ